jgi:hypothetical protein
MNAAVIEQIEIEIGQISLADQLWLMERLAHRIRKHALQERPSLEAQLAAMAHDPDIQRELRQIEAEFAGFAC